MVVCTEYYACPICGQSLGLVQKSYVCANGHCFDIAKQGYVNLLPVQQKKSKEPGDSKAMLQARRRFLNHAYYEPLISAMASLLKAHSLSSLLDLGCGEGYYAHKLKQSLQSQGQDIQFLGLDIAKPAIVMAARSAQLNQDDSQFCIASSFSPPYLDACFDGVYTVFAPVDFKQLDRIIRPSGIWLRVTAGQQHLKQLRQVIYNEVQDYQEHHKAPDGFQVIEEAKLTFPITLNQAHLTELLLMTPFYWQLRPEKQALFSKIESLLVDCDFEIRVYQKAGHL